MQYTIDDNEKNRLLLLTSLSTGCLSVFMGQPRLACSDLYVSGHDWVNGSIVPLYDQPDCPRNIVATLTDADNSCRGTLTITGHDPAGRVVVERMVLDGTIGSKTIIGKKIFAVIGPIVISEAIGGIHTVDTLNIGSGNIIGIPFDISLVSNITNVFFGGDQVWYPTCYAGLSTSGVDVSGCI